jgi:hypothetical protein
MKVSWYAPAAAPSGFTDNQLQVPARYNFAQAAIYRLKLTSIPGRNGLVLYPTLEVVPANAKTATFLAHSSVPVAFTDEDFDQVAAHNFVVKVIYLPDPPFQDLATTGLGEVVSTRLEPGADPIAEACRRGSILVIVRLGNIDLEAAHTPAMDAPAGYAPHAMMSPALPGSGAPSPGVMSLGKPPMSGLGTPMMPPNYSPSMGAPAKQGGVAPPTSPSAKLEDKGTIGAQQQAGYQPPPGSGTASSKEKGAQSHASRSWWPFGSGTDSSRF